MTDLESVIREGSILKHCYRGKGVIEYNHNHPPRLHRPNGELVDFQRLPSGRYIHPDGEWTDTQEAKQ